MFKEKMLTLEQLVKFCAENKMYNFSSDETGYKLCVQVPSKYETFEEKSTDSMLYGKVKLLHTNTNRNGSNVTYDAAEKCMSSIKYKPLLANFCEIDGVKDFTSHDMIIGEDGEYEYIEHQVGCFTVDEPYMEYDEEKDRHYIYAYVAIPREYTAAAEIIDRKGGTKVSAELAINKMSYDSKNKELLLEDIEVMGATCLGKNPESGEDVQEGMEGARLDITDFSAENNSLKFEQNEKLIETLEKLNSTLSRFDINNSTRKEENSVDLENKEIETMEEAKKKIVDDDSVVVTTEEDSTEDAVETPIEETPEVVENEDETISETEEPADESGDGEDTADTFSTEEDDDESEEFKCADDKKKKCSVEYGDIKKEFSVSLNAQIEALSRLVNDVYADDATWYSVEVYDKNLVMIDMWNGRAYRQDYKVKNDVYSLKNDRVEVYSTWMTSDEQKAFDAMKSNYSLIEEKLSKYEAEPEKLEILESAEYSSISDKAEFEELKKQENHFDLTVDEVKAKADEIILQYAKAGALNFAVTEQNRKEVGMKKFANTNKNTKRSRYGGLGKKEN